MWFYLGVVERDTGNNAGDLHEYFKRTLLPPKHITVMGKEIKIPASTTELSKIEMGDYLDRICAETDIPIPNPCESGFFCGKKTCPICTKKMNENKPIWHRDK